MRSDDTANENRPTLRSSAHGSRHAEEAIASCAITGLLVTMSSTVQTKERTNAQGVRNDNREGRRLWYRDRPQRRTRRLRRQFVSINEDHSLAPMLAGLPEGRCWCPHWGYVFKGQITVTYADREEVFEAGDAFYMTPGHVPATTKGSEFLQFSPAEAMRETVAAIEASMQQK